MGISIRPIHKLSVVDVTTKSTWKLQIGTGHSEVTRVIFIKMRAVLCLVVIVLACDGINGLLLPGGEYGKLKKAASTMSWYSRARRLSRPTHRIIDPTEDCFLVTSEEGELFFKSPSNEPSVCGIYMIAEPDKRIQVTFNYLDVPCDNGGLVACRCRLIAGLDGSSVGNPIAKCLSRFAHGHEIVCMCVGNERHWITGLDPSKPGHKIFHYKFKWVDGWELNGQVWPADSWDEDRVVESCDRRPQRKLVSRQNAALIQYRVPAQGKGFAINIRHLKNARPCNVMLFGAEGVYTLRNHGETSNCSVIGVSPAVVRIIDLNVGQAVKSRSPLEIETGIIHHCTKRGLSDYVEIGGASGLDHTKMEVLDTVCGLDSNEGRRPAFIACEDTVARLVSSGRFYNSITLAFAPLPLEDIEHADLICGMNDL